MVNNFLTLLLLSGITKTSNAFINHSKTKDNSSISKITIKVPSAIQLEFQSIESVHGIHQSSKSFLRMAGFGGVSGSVGEKKKKKLKKSVVAGDGMAKLRPKLQWDRYKKLKKSKDIRVAVRVINQDGTAKEGAEWTDVGFIKSENDAYSEVAVLRQRAIIAEHAARLKPLEFGVKDRVEWSYYDGEANDWALVNVTSNVVDVVDNIEKKIGFKGTADPNTGFYCTYDQGRVVNDVDKKSLLSDKGKRVHNY